MKNEFLVRSEDISTSDYGVYPGSRTVEELLRNGLIILDKWIGPTSHSVSSCIKEIFSLRRAGHSGTLDPRVSGVLPITLENACKVIPALQKLDKEYVGVMHLHKDVDNKKLSKTIKKFTGEIVQIPPVRSAVARMERRRKVYSIEILDRKGREVCLLIKCEAGTYIRKLFHSIGKELGSGAHMSELRRTRVGCFDESKLVKIQDLVDAYHFWKEKQDESIREFILPVEAVTENMKKIIVKDSSIPSIVNGSPLYSGGISRIQKGIEKNDMVAILSLKGELIALSKANMNSEEALKKKGLAAKTDRVIMEKNVYPKMK